MQHLFFVVTEGNILQHNIIIFRHGSGCLRTFLFLLLQNVGHFSDDCPQLCQIVAIGHDGNERRNQTNGKENDLNKSVGIQRTGTEQQASNGKNCDHSCRENGHGDAEIDIAPPHPFHIAGSTLFSGNHELFVGALRLAESLDDLDTVDVLHRRIIEHLRLIHGVLIAFGIATGHQGVAAKPDGHCRQYRQCHPPIQYKEIYQKSNGNQQV